jgi:3-hydroxy-3-methylglutaryl CoA synthase
MRARASTAEQQKQGDGAVARLIKNSGNLISQWERQTRKTNDFWRADRLALIE